MHITISHFLKHFGLLCGMISMIFVTHIQTSATQIYSNEVESFEKTIINPNLNPSIRINQIKSQLYPELFSPISPQVVDDTYRLPLSAPTTTFVTQTYFGPYSHQTVRAIDFFGNNLKAAASRKGVITRANFGGKWNTWCNSYQDCYDKGGVWNGNHIYIQHSDGSTALYIHLKPDTLRPGINLGVPTPQGTVLADIGSTGYTCGNENCSVPGPHLHFQVAGAGTTTTIATPFEDCGLAGNQCVDGIPQASRTYSSINYPASTLSTDGRSKGVYILGEDLAIDVTSFDSSATIKLGNPNTPTSTWTLNPYSGRIENPNNVCLADIGGSSPQLQGCNDSLNQKWLKLGRFNIKNQQTSKCLESHTGTIRGSGIMTLGCSESNYKQFFRLSTELITAGTPEIEFRPN
jgi:murein DD-endopeptidase MepM/ murein hydrolase activator NlpD